MQKTVERIVGVIKEKSYMNDFGDTVIDDIDNLIKQIENYE